MAVPAPEDVVRSPYRIDNRIRRSISNPAVLENTSNSWLAQFRSVGDGGVTIYTLGGAHMSFAPTGGADVSPIIDSSGTSVTYPEVWPGVDIQYVVKDAELEEVLVVKADPGTTTFGFDVVGDVDFEDRADGGVEIISRGSDLGTVSMPSPSGMHLRPVTVTDADGTPIDPVVAAPRLQTTSPPTAPTGAGARSLGSASIPASLGRVRIEVSAQLFAGRAAEAYPVRIDPSTGFESTQPGHRETSGFMGGVNLATGSYTAETTDAHVSVVGPPLEVKRFYNSAMPTSFQPWFLGGFGMGFSNEAVVTAVVTSSGDPACEYCVHVTWGDARSDYYPPAAGGGYESPPGVSDKVTVSGGAVALTKSDGTQYLFKPASSAGILDRIVDGSGHVQTYKYQTVVGMEQYGDVFLEKITDATSGRSLAFSWTSMTIGQNTIWPVITNVQTSSAGAAGPQIWTYQYLQSNGTYPGPVLQRVYDPEHPVASGKATTLYWFGTDCAPAACLLMGLAVAQLAGWSRPDGSTEGLYAPWTPPSGFNVPYRVGEHLVITGGSKWRYSYEPTPSAGVSMRTTVTDPENHTWVFVFDDMKRLVQRTDQAGAIRRWSYLADDTNPATVDGLLKDMTLEDGTKETYAYDSAGNRTSVTDRYGATSYKDYDSLNRETQSSDARSSGPGDAAYRTVTSYEGSSRRIMGVSPPAPLTATTTTYTQGTEAATGGGTQPAGLVARIVSPKDGTTTYSYLSNGDLASRTDGQGLTTTFQYDGLGRETSHTESGIGVPSATWTTTYDAMSRVKTVLEPVVANSVTGASHQKLIENEYFDTGWLRSTRETDTKDPSLPARVTSYAYDAAGHESSKTVSSGSSSVSSSTEYDGDGQVTAVVDRNGNRFEKSYDVRGNPDKVTLKGYQDDPAAGSAPRDLVVSDEDYDSTDRRVASVDAAGRRTTFANFSYGGQPQTVTLKAFAARTGAEGGGSGGVSDVVLRQDTFDRVGHLLTSSQGNGSRLSTTTWNNAGLKASETLARAGSSSWDRYTTWTYNGGGNVRSEVRHGSGGIADRQTDTTYTGGDATGLVDRSSVRMGADPSLDAVFTYDAHGKVLTTTDPSGGKLTFTNDALGRPTSKAEPAVAVESGGGAPSTKQPTTTWGYGVFGDRTQEKDPNGNVTTTDFDFLGRQVKVTYPSYAPVGGGSAVAAAESFGYDAVGNQISHVDRRGKTSTYAFDRLNRVYRSSTPVTVGGASAQAVEQKSYDAMGNVTKLTRADGAVTSFTFDMLDRMRSLSEVVRQPSPSTSTTWFDYDWLGNRTWTKDPRGFVSTSTFDSAGDKLTDVDVWGKTTTYTPSPFGEVLKTVDATNRCVQSGFDGAGRKVRVDQGCQLAAGSWLSTRTAYDGAGRPTTVTSPEGRQTVSAYDAAGRLSSVTQGSGAEAATTSYFYDAAGNNTRVRNGRGNQAGTAAYDTIVTYQSWNLPEQVIEAPATAGQAAANRTWTAVYDDAGRAVGSKLPGGGQITRTFDDGGRVVSEVASGGGVSGSRTMGYDIMGRMVSAGSPAGAMTATYNDRGQPLAVAGGNSSASYSYETWGGLKTRTDVAGTSSFAYDSAGRVQTQSDPLTGGTAKFFYDDANRPAYVERFAAGVGTTVNASTELSGRDYDAYGRVVSDWQAMNADSAFVYGPDYQRTYGYDRDGLLTSELVYSSSNLPADGGSYSYSYNSASQLVSASTPTGNVVYDYDKAGNRIRAGSTAFSFDAQNRLTSDGSTSYTWADRGVIASTVKAGVTTSYSFDGFGQEIQVGSVSYTRDSLGRVVSRGGQAMSYSGLSVEVCGDGSTTVAHTAAGDAPLSVRNGSQAAWAFTDAHDDLVALLDPAYFSVIATKGYDPFGAPTGSNGTAMGNIGFQSDWTDPSTKEVNMGARSYSPTADSFTSRDSFDGERAQPLSLNRYTYAIDNPLTNLDRDGHMTTPNVNGTAADYMRDVNANIVEYKQTEFTRMVDWGHSIGLSDSQIQGMLAWHFRDVVDPNVAKMLALAKANWDAAHPATSQRSTPVPVVARGARPQILAVPITARPGLGTVRINLFISDCVASLPGVDSLGLSGDCRDFDSSPEATVHGSRVSISFNFELGVALIIVQPSCTSPVGAIHLRTCVDAKPLSVVTRRGMCDSVPPTGTTTTSTQSAPTCVVRSYGTRGGDNQIWIDDFGVLTARIHMVNSMPVPGWLEPTIDGEIQVVQKTGNRVCVGWDMDPFPSIEAYQDIGGRRQDRGFSPESSLGPMALAWLFPNRRKAC